MSDQSGSGLVSMDYVDMRPAQPPSQGDDAAGCTIQTIENGAAIDPDKARGNEKVAVKLILEVPFSRRGGKQHLMASCAQPGA